MKGDASWRKALETIGVLAHLETLILDNYTIEDSQTLIAVLQNKVKLRQLELDNVLHIGF